MPVTKRSLTMTTAIVTFELRAPSEKSSPLPFDKLTSSTAASGDTVIASLARRALLPVAMWPSAIALARTLERRSSPMRLISTSAMAHNQRLL